MASRVLAIFMIAALASGCSTTVVKMPEPPESIYWTIPESLPIEAQRDLYKAKVEAIIIWLDGIKND